MRSIVQLWAALLMATSALANDTVASQGAGGLELQRSDAIDMVSEDLFISVDEIRVRYVFRNRTAADVETIVAFPAPENDLESSYQGWGDVAFPSDFRTIVDGKPVTARIERKAFFKDQDHTALLNRLRVPITPGRGEKDDIIPALDRLPAAVKRQLLSLGLVEDQQWDNGGHGLAPRWTVKQIWWWTQRFPAGRELIVEHRYVPGVGRNNGTALLYPDTPETREQISRHCVDKQFLATVKRLDEAGHVPMDRWIDYVLVTGANWRSPIGSFRLVVDKGKPDNLVSFCESGVKKISPTQFEVRHSNWRPTRDLNVLIVEPGR